MLSQKECTFSKTVRNLAGAVVLGAALFVAQGSLASAAGMVTAPPAQVNCVPSATTTVNVNFRTGPGTNFPIIRQLPANALVAVTGRNADRSWYQVVFNGETGWVITRYLRLTCVQGVPVAAPTPAPTPVPIVPPIGTPVFSANATTINFGQCVILSWNVPVATQVLLSYGALQSPVPVAGTQQVCPTLSTRYYLQVNNGANTQFFPVDITVVNPRNPANFRSNQYVVRPGQCPTLSWNVDNVQGVWLFENNRNPQGVAGNATRQICVTQPMNFALRVLDNAGRETLTPLTINILDAQPANVVFIANPTTLVDGQCAQLQWIAGNARSVNLIDNSARSNTVVGNVGDIQVCPHQTATYVIRAVLANGSVVERQQMVQVLPSAGAVATPIP